MQPRISIIVPCYNGEKYLRETLDCLLIQTIEDWECIIVNDGSTDGSLEIMKEYAANDSRYKYIDKENEGPSIARNTGVSKSVGQYLMFLDSDDIIDVSYLQKGTNYLDNNEKCSLYYSQTAYIGNKNGIMDNSFSSYKDLLARNSIVCTSIIRRSDFIRVNGFDINMKGYEDWDFYIRLLYHNDNVYQEPELLFFYRMHDNPCSINLNAKQKEEKLRTYFFDKNYEIYKEYYGYPQWIYSQYNLLEKEIHGLLTSMSYRLGHALLSPLKFLRDIFKMNNVK